MADEEVKQSALHDMCALITANPAGIVQDLFVPFCGVIGSFTMEPSDELKKKIVNVKILCTWWRSHFSCEMSSSLITLLLDFASYHNHVGDEEPWQLLIVQIPPMILHEYCGWYIAKCNEIVLSSYKYLSSYSLFTLIWNRLLNVFIFIHNWCIPSFFLRNKVLKNLLGKNL